MIDFAIFELCRKYILGNRIDRCALSGGDGGHDIYDRCSTKMLYCHVDPPDRMWTNTHACSHTHRYFLLGVKSIISKNVSSSCAMCEYKVCSPSQKTKKKKNKQIPTIFDEVDTKKLITSDHKHALCIRRVYNLLHTVSLEIWFLILILYKI